MARVNPGTLKETAKALFVHIGYSDSASSTIAKSLVMAEMRGVSSHGILLVPVLVKRIDLGLVGRGEQGEIIMDGGAVALIDGHHNLGQLVGVQAMEIAVSKAKQFGIGAVGVRHSHHFGAAAYYALTAVNEGCIGIVVSNAMPLIPAPGGAQPLFGTNALAVGMPSGREKPVILDMAMSKVAQGKIRHAAHAGMEIPSGWATDEQGVPTTDAAAALKGMMVPIGGPKGFGLSMVVDILSGVLTGGAWGKGVRGINYDMENPQDCGHFFVSIDVSSFGPKHRFEGEMEKMIQWVRGARRAPDVDRLFVPGEIEWERTRDYDKDEIPIEDNVLDDFLRVAAEHGIEADHLRQ